MPVGFALAAGFTAVLVGTAAATRVSRHDLAGRVAVVAAFVAVGAALTAGAAGAACTAAMGWLFTNGFLVNGRGDLQWRGAADGVLLAVFAAAAFVGLAVGRRRYQRHARADWTAEDVSPAPPPAADFYENGVYGWVPPLPAQHRRGSAGFRPPGPDRTERRRNG